MQLPYIGRKHLVIKLSEFNIYTSSVFCHTFKIWISTYKFAETTAINNASFSNEIYDVALLDCFQAMSNHHYSFLATKIMNRIHDLFLGNTIQSAGSLIKN